LSRRLVIGLGLACFCGALGAWFELRQTDEERIESLVDRLIQDADRRDVGAIAPWVSDRYHDGRGFDRPGVLAALARFLQSQSQEKIVPVRVKVGRIDDGRAEVSAKVILAAAAAPGAARGTRDGLEVDLVLAREGSTWRVLTSEDWEIPAEDVTMLP